MNPFLSPTPAPSPSPGRSHRRRLLDGLSVLAGTLGAAALYGYHVGGEVWAMTLPVVLHLPAVALACAASEPDVPAAPATPRSPGLVSRLSRFLGRPRAQAVVDQAKVDLSSGFWPLSATILSYCVTGDRISPLADAAEVRQAMQGYSGTFIRLYADGSSIHATSRDRRLHSYDGRPAYVRSDRAGAPIQADWRQDEDVSTWTPDQGPLTLGMDGMTVTHVIRNLLCELEFGDEAGCERIVERLTRMADEAEKAYWSDEQVTVHLVNGDVGLVRLRTSLTATRPAAEHSSDGCLPRR